MKTRIDKGRTATQPTNVKKKENAAKAWEDAIVAEIHAIREAHAKKFNFDLDAIFNDFKNYEKKLKEQRATRSRKKPA
ncbi:MAG: hypothetical protein AB7T49_17820 [Oligoflexales bacterium]